MKKQINAKQGLAIFEFNGQEIKINLSGIDYETICYLALQGAHEILCRRADPNKSWQSIRNGNITPKKQPPLIIRAIAQVYNKKPDEALSLWNNLNPKNKSALKQDARIRVALVTLGDMVEVDINKL